MARRCRIRFIQYRIVGIEFCDGFHPTRGVVLAEHAREVRLHEAVIVDGFSGHVLPSGSGVRKASVVARSIWFARLSVERVLSSCLGKTLFDSAVGSSNRLRIVISFSVVSPRRRRRSGEFPKCSPEMYRIGKAGGLGHIVERALVSISSACARRMRASSCQR